VSGRLGALVAHELRRRLRNRSAVITAFVAPLLVAVVFGLLVGGTKSAKFEIGVVDQAATASSGALATSLTAPDDQSATTKVVTFTAVADRRTAERQVDNGDLDAAIVIAHGFDASAAASTDPALLVIRSPDRTVSGQVAMAVATSISSQASSVDLAVRTVAALTGTIPDAALIAAAQGATPAITLEPATAGHAVDAQAFYGAAMAIIFLFFTVGFAGRSVLAERRDGTLARVLSTPTSAAQVLAAKTVAVAILAEAGFLVVWGVTTVVFGARWGPPLVVAAVITATVVALAGVATFVAGLSRTQAQADAATSAVTFALALLGGNFVGPNAPPLLKHLALFTPNGWALRAFEDLSADAAGFAHVALTLVVLAGFGLLFGSVGLFRLRRGLAR